VIVEGRSGRGGGKGSGNFGYFPPLQFATILGYIVFYERECVVW